MSINSTHLKGMTVVAWDQGVIGAPSANTKSTQEKGKDFRAFNSYDH